MNTFGRTTASIAAWNLAGFGGIPSERISRQIEGLALLDAEVLALVEINPLSVLETLQTGLAQKGVIYHRLVLPQQKDLHIGILFKEGVTASNPRLLDGSDLGDARRRKAFLADIKVGAFDFLLIVVHLKSGRDAADQQIRDDQAKIIGQFITQRRALIGLDGACFIRDKSLWG